MLSNPQRYIVLSLSILGIINVVGLAATITFKYFRHLHISTSGKATLSYDDWDVQSGRLLMTIEDNDQYGLHGQQADSEWLSTTPAYNGFVRVGEEHRYVLTALGHQIHCIRVLRTGIVNPMHPSIVPTHLNHCTNYLRAYALCSSDLTLERHDPLQRNFTSERIGATHACPRDWTRVYEEFRRNRAAWFRESASEKHSIIRT